MAKPPNISLAWTIKYLMDWPCEMIARVIESCINPHQNMTEAIDPFVILNITLCILRRVVLQWSTEKHLEASTQLAGGSKIAYYVILFWKLKISGSMCNKIIHNRKFYFLKTQGWKVQRFPIWWLIMFAKLWRADFQC